MANAEISTRRAMLRPNGYISHRCGELLRSISHRNSGPESEARFQLNDTQIGLLSGLAFAFVFSVASLPIASYADRGRRVRVLGVSSPFGLSCRGVRLRRGLMDFLVARIGVGLARPVPHRHRTPLSRRP